MTGLVADPTTSSPVIRRVVTDGFGVPSSSWFGICWMRSIVSVFVTAYAFVPFRVMV